MSDTNNEGPTFPGLGAYQQERDMYRKLGAHVQIEAMRHGAEAFDTSGETPVLVNGAVEDYADAMVAAQEQALHIVTGLTPGELAKLGDVTKDQIYLMLGLQDKKGHASTIRRNDQTPGAIPLNSEQVVPALRNRYVQSSESSARTDDELYGNFKDYVTAKVADRDDLAINPDALPAVNRVDLINLAYLLRDGAASQQILQTRGLEDLIKPTR